MAGNISMAAEVRLTINGQLYKVNATTVPLDTSLNTFIRNHAHLKGTKFMCREGGCGACVVTVSGLHPVTRERRSWAANSCLVSVFSCHELDILTVEGIGGRKQEPYHPIQRRLAEYGGSQCGYCSPGMVMSMYSLLASRKRDQSLDEDPAATSEPALTAAQIEQAFDGNICRCTGYRSILDAFKSFAQDLEPPIVDIEDLVAPKTATSHCLTFADGRKWYKVTSVSEAFDVLQTITNNELYTFVGGNTGHGVYRRSDRLKFFIDISSIAELHRHTFDRELIVGVGVSLTELIDLLEQTAEEYLSFAYCIPMAKHVRKMANLPVRNIGTIAGNLMLKHQHPEFPSDLFLLLETVGAKLTVVCSADGDVLTVSPLDFLKLNMHKKMLTTVRLPPYDHVSTTLRSYKIMPVAQNSRAYVNGAFLLQLCPDRKLCTSITICFGGINPSFVHAQQTESYLTGKPLFEELILSQALRILERELKPDCVLPDASPAYRKQLALALLYRFALSVHPSIGRTLRSGTEPIERPLVSSGRQTFDTYQKRWPLTQSIPKLEALAQCSGQAVFINDMPVLPNELHGALVLSNEVQGRIVTIDASEALAVSGVRAFFCAQDIPGFNNFMPLEMGFAEVEEIFCSGEVQFAGQVVGLICAESFELANRAAAMVRVDYKRAGNRIILPTVQDVVDALDYSRVSDQPYDRHGIRYHLAKEGTHTVSGRFDLRGQYHGPMETQVSLCVPHADSMDVYCATQWLDHVQIAVSQALQVRESSLNLTVRRIGGAYGAKLTRATQIACACAVAAFRTGVPVRMILPLETAMSGSGKRCGSVSEYEVSFDGAGRISRLSHTFIHDAGATLNVMLGGVTSDLFKNCYRTDYWKLRTKIARTDCPPNTWARAPGTSEGIAMVENIMEHIAHRTGLDPVDVRMANISRENKMHTLLPRFRRQVEYDERKRQIGQFNEENRWRKRGLAIMPMQYPLELNSMKNAVVSVYSDDGSVSITHGGIEMGQGINTKVAQVAAHLLGVPVEKIVVQPSDSLLNANSNASQHTQATDGVAFAVKRCCEILLERLRPYRTLLRRTSWEEMVRNASLDDVDLQVSFFATPTDMRTYTIWGLACGEIELDVLTGQVLVRRVDILEDVGESLNPGIDVGQIEGAFVMGLGYYLTEALVYAPKNGALVNNRTWNYKVPGHRDIPVDFRVSFLSKSSNAGGVLRSKATGEPAFSLSPVIVYAVRNALRAARRDAGLPDTWLHMGSGMTPEKIFALLESSIEQYKYE
ncbi:xanthine dehydrogenase-like [Anopheles stephensi]|uniref:xanthine dehydrogenase-like n=1 Tax=Anopheles stephensi TaxID=30069 RepID=UPI001658C02E|nr:xanthine dehydrogenase-like [Anopheles stephensi]